MEKGETEPETERSMAMSGLGVQRNQGWWADKRTATFLFDPDCRQSAIIGGTTRAHDGLRVTNESQSPLNDGDVSRVEAEHFTFANFLQWMGRRWVCALLPVLCCVAFGVPACAGSHDALMHLTGHVSSIQTNIKGELVSKSTFRFEMDWDGVRYTIQQWAEDGDDFWNRISGTDGQDSYTLLCGWPTPEDKESDKNYTETGMICLGLYPYNSSKVIQLLWLGFTGKLRRDFPGGIQLDGISYAPAERTRVTITDSRETGLLTNITAHAPGMLVLNSNSIPLTGEFSHGYEVWNYRVLSYTNHQGVILPKHLEYAQFVPTFSNDDSRWHIQQLLSISITLTAVDLLSVAPRTFLPSVSQPTVRVADFRVPEHVRKSLGMPLGLDHGTAYAMFDGVWPGRDDPRVSSLTAKARLDEVPVFERPMGFPRILVLVGMGLSTCVIAFIGLKRLAAIRANRNN